MIVIVDERPIVVNAFISLIEKEGIAAIGFSTNEFESWIVSVADSDLTSVEAFLIGDCPGRIPQCRAIAGRARVPIIAMSESRSLDETLDLFAAGVDDVVRKPVHVKEILARINAVGRRSKKIAESKSIGEVRVFFDGRDPEVSGEVISLPRRERRILEYLARNSGCRVTKSQLFNAVYGLFNDEIDENVIESHLSKLRKRLRERLGYDPIDSKRFLGYRLFAASAETLAISSAQAQSGVMAPEIHLT